GKLVLYEILKNCANVTEGKRYVWKPTQPKRDDFVQGRAATAPLRERRIAAYDDFNANRCVGFDGVNITQAELDRMLTDAAAGGAPGAEAMVVEVAVGIRRPT